MERRSIETHRSTGQSCQVGYKPFKASILILKSLERLHFLDVHSSIFSFSCKLGSLADVVSPTNCFDLFFLLDLFQDFEDRYLAESISFHVLLLFEQNFILKKRLLLWGQVTGFVFDVYQGPEGVV